MMKQTHHHRIVSLRWQRLILRPYYSKIFRTNNILIQNLAKQEEASGWGDTREITPHAEQ
jgi:hypothetical protein